MPIRAAGGGSDMRRGRSGGNVPSFAQLASLHGRVALVVGGAGHIGHAACTVLAELGADVAVADMTTVADQPVRLALKVDLSSEDDTRSVVAATVGDLGGLDILVHCAAYTAQNEHPGWAVPFAAQSVDAWDAAYRVNVTSAFVLAQEAAPHLKRSTHGSIVLMSSIYGVIAPDFRLYEGTSMTSPTGYSVTKSGLLQLTRHLSTSLAPDVRVNAISPGGVLRGQDPEFVRRYEAGTPLRRMAHEDDIKGAIAYLASDLSAYVTGTNLLVDGGRSVW